MAPSLREIGRKATQLFSRNENRSSKQSQRFTILQSLDEGDEDEGSPPGPRRTGSNDAGPSDTQQETTDAIVPGSMFRFIDTNFMEGSSVADMDPAEAGNRWEAQQQALREVDNFAMWPISSRLTSMEHPQTVISGSDRTGESSSAGPSNTTSRACPPLQYSGPNIHRHQAKPSVPEALEAGFYQGLYEQHNAPVNREREDDKPVRSARARLASMSTVPSTNESVRERRLRGTLVRTSSMNWEVNEDPFVVAPEASNQQFSRGKHQARVESSHSLANRAWDNFSESELAGDSKRELVQVAPGRWELGSRRGDSLAPGSANPVDRLRDQYQPMHPSQIIPEELYPTNHILANDMPTVNYRMNPVVNPLWEPQYAHPSIRNLSSALQHASTDIHAMWQHNLALNIQAVENAETMNELRRQLARLTAIMETTGLGHLVPEVEYQAERSDPIESSAGTGNEADDEETSESQ